MFSHGNSSILEELVLLLAAVAICPMVRVFQNDRTRTSMHAPKCGDCWVLILVVVEVVVVVESSTSASSDGQLSQEE